MATYTFSGQDANNTTSADSLVVNDTGEITFVVDDGGQGFFGDDPTTVVDENALDTISFTDYDGTVYTDVTFKVNYEGYANWANGNKVPDPLSDPPTGYNIMVIEITSGPEVGETYTLILDPLDPSEGTFGNGNHRASLPSGDGIHCFLRGTQIDTSGGMVAIEDLVVNDQVDTRTHGKQKIRWIGSTIVKASRFRKHLSPIRIKAGALGENTPSQDLLVSPAHRMLVSGWQAELLFGEAEALVAAKSLVNDSTITVAHDLEEFEYFHIMFDNHEIVMSNGAPSESFHATAEVVNAMEAETRAELLELFPDLEFSGKSSLPMPVLSEAEAALLR